MLTIIIYYWHLPDTTDPKPLISTSLTRNTASPLEIYDCGHLSVPKAIHRLGAFSVVKKLPAQNVWLGIKIHHVHARTIHVHACACMWHVHACGMYMHAVSTYIFTCFQMMGNCLSKIAKSKLANLANRIGQQRHVTNAKKLMRMSPVNQCLILSYFLPLQEPMPIWLVSPHGSSFNICQLQTETQHTCCCALSLLCQADQASMALKVPQIYTTTFTASCNGHAPSP